MTLWSEPEDPVARPAYDLMALLGIGMALALWFSYSFFFEMVGEHGFIETPELWVAVVGLQGLCQFGVRAGRRKPGRTPRSVRQWVHLWMVSSMVVCGLGLTCRFLTGRMEPATLLLYQAVIPTALCLSVFIENRASRRA